MSRLARALATMPGAAPGAGAAWRANLRGEAWLSGQRDDASWLTAPPLPATTPAMAALDAHGLTRERVRAYIDDAWRLDDALFSGLNGEEAFLEPPWHNLRRPQVFYYGHAAAFYVNKLVAAGLLGEDEREQPHFEQLFEVGVDEMPADDMSLNEREWPAIADVRAFRQRVRARVWEAAERQPELGGGAGPARVTAEHPLWALLMGVEHQRVHIETSSVLFREMDLASLQRPARWPADHPSAARATGVGAPAAGREYPPASALVPHGGGEVQLGRGPATGAGAGRAYGWDLEFGSRRVRVPPFEAASTLVSNGAFRQFVAAGGYGRRELWSDEGWAWRRGCGATEPRFWERAPEGAPADAPRFLRSTFSVHPMPWDWPAVVNLHEALAYCAWRTQAEGCARAPYRPLREAEHTLLRTLAVDAAPAAATADGANIGLRWGTESPVHAMPPSPSGHHDLMGNVWELCADAVAPLDGFCPHPLYPDFSAPAFDGAHFVVAGGSFASSGAYACVRARNFFRPHFYQHAGFRLARDAAVD